MGYLLVLPLKTFMNVEDLTVKNWPLGVCVINWCPIQCVFSPHTQCSQHRFQILHLLKVGEWDSKNVTYFCSAALCLVSLVSPRHQAAQVWILCIHHATIADMDSSHRSSSMLHAMPHWLNNPWTSGAMSRSLSSWKGVGDLVKTSYHKPIIHPDKPWTNNPYSSPVLSKAIPQREEFSWCQFSVRQLHNERADIFKTTFPPT